MARRGGAWLAHTWASWCVGGLLVVALVGPLILKDPNAQVLADSYRPPAGLGGGNPANLLGTDILGRDVLARAVSGLRTSMESAALAVIVAAILGTVIGVSAGYIGGALDSIVMRLIDIQVAIPNIMLLLLLISVLEPSFISLVAVLALLAWVVYVRVVRAEVLALKGQEMVVALVALGVSPLRIVVRHVLPNVAGPLIVVTTIEFARLVVAGAAVSYLGMGIPPPEPTLGGMIAESQTGMTAGLWWPVVVPAVLLSLLVLSVNGLGDRLRERLDPRARTRVGGKASTSEVGPSRKEPVDDTTVGAL